MKHQITALLAIGAMLLGTTSCEKELQVYSTDTCQLNFDRDFRGVDDRKMETNYTFVYSSDDVVDDTLWVTVKTVGYLSDKDRPFLFEQIKSDKTDAQSGVHYVPFDDPELVKKFYFIPAGKAEQRAPIVVKRDASLKTEDVRLYVTFKDNGEFTPGYEDYNTMRYCIGDRLTKPASWDGTFDYYFGEYSVTRHQFMIDVTGKNWDDNFISKTLGIPYDQDFMYIMYLAKTLYNALEEENARRAEEGLDVLKDENGYPITFDFGAPSN